MNKIRPHLSYANVTATLALFVALGGTGYAALQLPKNSVGTPQLKRGAVTTSRIHGQAVTNSRIRRATITGSRIRKASITGTQIRDLSIKGTDIDLGSLGEIQQARRARLSDTADNANKLGGLTVDQLRDRCPTGAVLGAGGCIESNARPQAVWDSAAQTCASNATGRGGRLPTLGELGTLPNQAGGSAEWTSDLVSATNPPQVALENLGGGPTTFDTTDHEHPFRCVFVPTNQ